MNTSQITTKEIEVPTSSRTYQVTVGAGILEEIGSICRSSVGGDTCCVISDSTVAPLYAERVSRSLKEAGYPVNLLSALQHLSTYSNRSLKPN